MLAEKAAVRARARAVLLVACAFISAVACGLGTTGTGEDVAGPTLDSGGLDATLGADVFTQYEDAGSPTDAGLDINSTDADDDSDADAATAINCDGVTMNSCATCVGKPTACAATGTCVAECASDCPGARVACFRCFGGGVVVQGTCEVEDDAGYCMNGAYAPGAACPCAGKDAAACPGDFQVCGPMNLCQSCGEPGTDKQICKGGPGMLKCDVGPGGPDGSAHLTCH